MILAVELQIQQKSNFDFAFVPFRG